MTAPGIPEDYRVALGEEDLDVKWRRLREPFAKDQLEKKPQVNCYNCTQATKAAKSARDKHCDRHQVRECPNCHAYITTGHIDLDYVGHANATNRLLEVDPTWTWEPFSTDPRGLPALDPDGNLWIRLTVLGVSKPGVGDGNSLKEKIGDAIRNAAMRFGVALDLWAKIELRHDEGVPAGVNPETGEVPMEEDRRLPSRREMYGPGNNDEALTDEPAEEEVRMIRKGQLIEIKQLEKQLGKDSDDQRPSRLAFYKWAGGREVGSSKELTEAEADMVIMELRKRVPAQAEGPAFPVGIDA